MARKPDSLLVVSNRAPYVIRRRAGKIELTRTVGGLASTLDDTLRKRGGVWLAWSGAKVRAKKAQGRSRGHSIQSIKAPDGSYRLKLLSLTDQQVQGFYHGFANDTLWPLCHYFIGKSAYDDDSWKTYQTVNRVYARAAASLVSDDGLVWVHDYHLALVPSMLRHYVPSARIAVFWHIPFPGPSVLRVNPRARDVVAGMLGADLIGFHTPEYVRHFLHCAETLCDARTDLARGEVVYQGHVTRVGAYPIGTEAGEFSKLGALRETTHKAREIREDVGVEHLLLGVDRLDYTKGVLERIEAYETYLADNPGMHGKVCLLQIQVPSREDVPEYQKLRRTIEQAVGRVQGRFSRPDWTPLRYIYRGFGRRELTAYYRAADVLLVTPLRDGLNLIGQEFAATRADEDGVIIFSEFAGAADRLREAILVNPYDPGSITSAIRTAIRMRPSERRSAMRAMRERVMAEDVEWWLGQFLHEAESIERRSKANRRR